MHSSLLFSFFFAVMISGAIGNGNDLVEMLSSCPPGRSCRPAKCAFSPPSTGRTVKLDGQYGSSISHCGETLYRFIKECKTRREAKVDCEKRGGHLWTIETSLEYSQVQAKINSNKFWGDHWWIGADSVSAPGKPLRWLGGAICNWKQLSENNDKEACVDIYGANAWGDHDCDLKLPYVCEIPANKHCGCLYDGNWYPYGHSVIALFDHCCSRIYCKPNQGIVIVPEKNGCQCCRHPANKHAFLRDGATYKNRKCCKGELLFTTPFIIG